MSPFKPALLAAAIAMVAMMTPASHADAAPNRQQARMAQCHQQVRGLHGAARQSAFRNCLRGRHLSTQRRLSPQQQRMSSCNARAAGLHGAARKRFMSTCLHGGY